ncbi:MAG: gliding motility-associated C-terminal domain-containing protein [Chitinophagales bacterium]|nr:gliding motility-associated C-terminal domain-containing protein [Chitinophagales bacterium]
MNKFLLCGLMLLICSVGRTQVNMVPNGNFEYYTTCPNSLSQTANCTGWSSWTNGTSDYFNTCSSGGVSVPSNTFGYQQPASGNAYVGGYQNATPTASPYKEYITRPIIPLQVGVAYEVSISVSLANIYGAVGVDDIGIYFYIGAPTFNTITTRMQVVPQVEFSGNGAYADTMNWVRLVKTFVADSAYTNIAIGSFKDPSLVVTQQVGSGTTSYYYFDSVVVKPSDSVNFIMPDTLKCAGDSFDLQYFVSSPGVFGSGNVFSAQLSDPTGNFTNDTTNIVGTDTSKTNGVIHCKIPLTIAPGTQYRIRLLSSKPKYASKESLKDITIGVHPQDLTATVGMPLCEGDAINLDVSTSTGNVNYKWTGPAGFTSTLQSPSIAGAADTNNGYYIVTASVYHCTSIDSVEVAISRYPVVSLTNNSPICVDSTLKLTAIADMPGLSYTWTGPGGFSSGGSSVSIDNSTLANAGAYTLVASNNGCEVKLDADVKIVSIDFDLGNDAFLCNGETITLVVDSIEGSYLWQDGSTDTMYTVTEAGRYELSISNPVCGVVTHHVDVSYEKCECEPFVPNAFTPNNDGLNDKVKPILDCNVTEYKFIIVNRFGEVMFKSTTPGEAWDGVYKGQRAELSTYYYLLQLTGPRDKHFQFKGDIILIR